MDLKKKIGVLPGSSQHEAVTQPHGVLVERGKDELTRQPKEVVALKLWREWAAETLGPMSAEPTAAELNTKSKKVKSLERKCADLAARAQRRLEVSAALRSTLAGGIGGAAAWGGSPGGSTPKAAPSTQPTQGTREAIWAAREARKTAAYDAARAAGAAEREASPALVPSTTSVAVPDLKSRTMLNALLSNNTVGSSPPQYARQGSVRRPSSAHAGLRPWDSPPASAGAGGMGVLTRVTSFSPSPADKPSMNSPGQRARPMSASARLLHSMSTMSRGVPGGVPGGGADPAELSALQKEIEQLKTELQEARHASEAQADLESQLRDTIDMLRARAHAQSMREVEAQRRLQQHARLEPLFDRLAETFVFKTPEEVVERLEFLEDDKLGSFDQLLRTQEEVGSLQAQLATALDKVEQTKTALTTEHITATGRLQARNDELRVELAELERVNARLADRQEALVALQTAVLNLWGHVSDDPLFVAANSEIGMAMNTGTATASVTATATATAGASSAGCVAAPSAVSSEGLDAQAVLAVVQEYLTARNPQMASRHYLDMQRVANRVWLHHLSHKPKLRGKVVETFEALSNIADIMASKIKTIQDQMARAKESERSMEDSLRRLEIQKRALGQALERRDALVRDMSGVPRKDRPHSAAAYHATAQMDAVSWGQGGYPSPSSSSFHLGSPASLRRPPRPYSALSTASSRAARHPTPNTGGASPAGPDPRHVGGAGGARQRPVSAPVRRRSAAGPAPGAGVMPDGLGYAMGPLTVVGDVSSGGARVHVAEAPQGAHWQALVAEGAQGAPGGSWSRPTSARSISTGALYQAGGGAPSGAHGAPAAGAHAGRVSAAGSPASCYGAQAPPAHTGAHDAGAHHAVPHSQQQSQQGHPELGRGGVGGEGGSAGGKGRGSGEEGTPGSGGQPKSRPRWTPPARSAIEASFLSRLQRAASSSSIPV